MRALREFHAEGLYWHLELDYSRVESDFAAHVHGLLGRPKATEMWAVVDGQYAGRIAIQHELTEALRVMGWHIGYDTAPSFRGRGVASAMLASNGVADCALAWVG